FAFLVLAIDSLLRTVINFLQALLLFADLVVVIDVGLLRLNLFIPARRGRLLFRLFGFRDLPEQLLERHLTLGLTRRPFFTASPAGRRGTDFPGLASLFQRSRHQIDNGKEDVEPK